MAALPQRSRSNASLSLRNPAAGTIMLACANRRAVLLSSSGSGVSLKSIAYSPVIVLERGGRRRESQTLTVVQGLPIITNAVRLKQPCLFYCSGSASTAMKFCASLASTMTNEYGCANPASSRKRTKLESLERRNPVTETGKVNDNVAQLAIPSQYRNSEWREAE